MPQEDQKNSLGWVKDSVLTDEILKCLDSTEEPDYVYTISVQGHGAYPEEPVLEDPEIMVSGSPTREKKTISGNIMSMKFMKWISLSRS